MRTFRIRATGDVLNTANATRKHQLDGEVLVTFGREAVYIEADELPSELINDNYLRIDTVDAAPAGANVIQRVRRILPPGPPDGVPSPSATTTNRLKSSWVQEPADAAHRPDIHPGHTQAADAGDTPELKSSWVQEPTNAADPNAVAELKSSWVQQPNADGGPNDTGKPKANRKRP